MSLINVPKRKTPQTMPYLNEIHYNDGYYFEACDIGHNNNTCKYLDFGCTGCLPDDLKTLTKTAIEQDAAKKAFNKAIEDLKKTQKALDL